jgi:hypothetical protein
MVPINLEFEFGEDKVNGTAEQLDQVADTAGFMRYQVVAAERRSVIYVNIEEVPHLSETVLGAENHYEATQYAEHFSGFSEDEVFTSEEVGVIASAIQVYNTSRRLKFDQLHFDF